MNFEAMDVPVIAKPTSISGMTPDNGPENVNKRKKFGSWRGHCLRRWV